MPMSRALFSSAVDAERAYVSLISAVSDRRAGAVTIQETIRHLTGEEDLPTDEPVFDRGAGQGAYDKISEATAAPMAAPGPLNARDRAGAPAPDSRRGLTFLRSMLPNRRPN